MTNLAAPGVLSLDVPCIHRASLSSIDLVVRRMLSSADSSLCLMRSGVEALGGMPRTVWSASDSHRPSVVNSLFTRLLVCSLVL